MKLAVAIDLDAHVCLGLVGETVLLVDENQNVTHTDLPFLRPSLIAALRALSPTDADPPKLGVRTRTSSPAFPSFHGRHSRTIARPVEDRDRTTVCDY